MRWEVNTKTPGVSLPEGIRKAPLVLSYPFTPPPPPLLELSLPPPLSPAPTPPQSKLSPAPTPEKAPTTIAGCEWAVLRCCRPEVELGDSRGQWDGTGWPHACDDVRPHMMSLGRWSDVAEEAWALWLASPELGFRTSLPAISESRSPPPLTSCEGYNTSRWLRLSLLGMAWAGWKRMCAVGMDAADAAAAAGKNPRNPAGCLALVMAANPSPFSKWPSACGDSPRVLFAPAWECKVAPAPEAVKAACAVTLSSDCRLRDHPTAAGGLAAAPQPQPAVAPPPIIVMFASGSILTRLYGEKDLIRIEVRGLNCFLTNVFFFK